MMTATAPVASAQNTTGRQGHRSGLGTPPPRRLGEGFGFGGEIVGERVTYENWTGPLVDMFEGEHAIILSDGKGTDAVMTDGVGAVEYNGKRGDTMTDFATALDGLLGPGAAAALIHPNLVVHVNGVAMDDPERRVRLYVDIVVMADLMDRNGIEIPDDEDFDKADMQ